MSSRRITSVANPRLKAAVRLREGRERDRGHRRGRGHDAAFLAMAIVMLIAGIALYRAGKRRAGA